MASMIPASERLLLHSPYAERKNISPWVQHIRETWPDGQGNLFVLEPYPGISVWSNHVYMSSFELRHLDDYRYLKLNYCMGGRCEVPLEDGRFVYLENGILSIDLNQTMGELSLPTREYQGFGLIVGLSEMENAYPGAFRECGIELLEAEALLADRHGSFLRRVSSEWDRLAREFSLHLQKGDLDLYGFRYHLLELLWLLKVDGQVKELTVPSFLTRGQRALVAQAEEMLTKNLSRRVTIHEAADRLGISDSSLKKYFAQVYGKPISVYLREKRMELARALLADPSRSILEIAAEAGYENHGKFSAAFKACTGTTPTEYRRLCLAAQQEKGKENETI